MARTIQAIKGGKLHLTDNVEEIYEKTITPYGNGAKIDSQKKYIGRRAYVIILKKSD
jgi:putative transposon-encoded protein